MTPFAIELRNVRKSFADFHAVKGISLQIQQGEFFSLLGPSGCGKTTTLRMIAGFEQPTSGEIRLLGKEVSNQPPNRRNVNMVFQNYALFPHMTVFENVAFGLQTKKVPADEIKTRATEVLNAVRLPGMEARKPAQLSGGQQQRVALARALVNRPAVLLLDEPLGALDQKLRKEMQLELKRLQREVGITFIYVTHDQEEALTMSDRICVMHAGEVLQVDEPRALYEHPTSRFAADFIGTTNFLKGSLVSSEGKMATVNVEGLGPIRVEVALSLPAGQSVTLAVRPERLKLAAKAPENEDNQAVGKLSEIVFVGNDTHYFVALSNGVQIMVREQNQGEFPGAPSLEIGQRVYVFWSATSTSLLVD